MLAELPDETNKEPFEDVHLWDELNVFWMPGDLWLALLTLAQLYGWKPAGTKPTPPELLKEFDPPCLDGAYYPPNGQTISCEDARRLADALERLLPDIPDGVTEQEGDMYAGWRARSSSVMHRLGAIKPIMLDLIIYCREHELSLA